MGSVFNTLCIEIKHSVKKTVQKMPSFFFHELKLIIVLFLICNSYVSWSTKFFSLKLSWDFPFSLLFQFYWSLYFCSTKCKDSLTLKHYNFFQNQNNRSATHSSVTRPLIFKLQQKVWKFNDICVSWSSPKTNSETNFLNIKNWSFEYVSFSQQWFLRNV